MQDSSSRRRSSGTAQKLGATHLVDIATLTVRRHPRSTTTSGLFGTPETVEQVRTLAERAGNRVWPLPLFEE